MKIKNIKLQNFKKFSNLTIDNLPNTVKLVVLLGPNGCGKSSLIESMEVARRIYGLQQIPWNDSNFDYYIKKDILINKVYHQIAENLQTREDILVQTQLSKLSFHGTYYIRNLANPSEVTFQQARLVPQITLDLVKEHFINIEFYNQTDYNETEWVNYFNVRTPYRNIGTQSGGVNDSTDLKQRTWQRLVDGDPFFLHNWRTLCSQWIKDSSDFIVRGDYSRWSQIIRDTFVPIEDSLKNVLGGNWKLSNLGDLKQNRGFIFEKDSTILSLDQLSSGESAVVDLVLNHIVIKKEFGDEVIYVIDEPELHVASAVRGKLIEELFRLTPEKGQLWISTHSIEIFEKSLELYSKDPSAVAFLDFTPKNFDQKETLSPVEPTYQIRSRVLEHSIGNLKDRLLPETIIFCEGEPEPKRGEYSDAVYYGKIFDGRWPIVDFMSVGGKKDVDKEIDSSTHMTGFVKDKNVQILGLRDRDDLADAETIRLDYLENGIRVLPFRTIEHCFVQPDVLRKFCEDHQLEPNFLLNEWNGILKEQETWPGKESDKMKRAIQELHGKVRESAPHVLKGESTGRFQLQLASCIKQGISTYKKLEDAIFGDDNIAIEVITECIESERTN
ncbi:MAG: AAA family ATPase [Candidatus Poribacteria bacterium]|nr:AAA family ATPase [Candidatus Poribacteria bacterium]